MAVRSGVTPVDRDAKRGHDRKVLGFAFSLVAAIGGGAGTAFWVDHGTTVRLDTEVAALKARDAELSKRIDEAVTKDMLGEITKGISASREDQKDLNKRFLDYIEKASAVARSGK